MGTRDSRPRGPRYPDSHPMGERIRERRETLELNGVELAARVGISPSYLSLIENRGRIPAEDVARRLAEELGDDVDLYIAWSRSRNVGDLEAHLRHMDRYVSEYGDAGQERRRRRDEDADVEDEAGDEDSDVDELASSPPSLADDVLRIRLRGPASEPRSRGRRLFQSMFRPTKDEADGPPQDTLSMSLETPRFEEVSPPRPTVRIPLLQDGGDPDDPDAVEEILELDPRLLPPDVSRPFAYRPDRRSVRRVAGRIEPNDLVVLDRDFDDLDPRIVHAVRHRGRVILARAVRKGGHLALLGAPGDPGGFELIAIERRRGDRMEAIRDVVVGRVVATLRWW